MAKIDYTPDARVLVGIDISKHRHEVLIACPGKTRRRRMTITDPDLLHCLTLGLVAVVACSPLGLLALKLGAKHLQI